MTNSRTSSSPCLSKQAIANGRYLSNVLCLSLYHGTHTSTIRSLMSLMILTPALCFRCTTSYVHLLVVMIQITFLSNCFTLVAPCLGFGISSNTEVTGVSWSGSGILVALEMGPQGATHLMERCFRNNTIVCLLNIPLLPCEINHVHAPSCLLSFSSLQVLVPPRRRRTCHDALPPCISCLVRTGQDARRSLIRWNDIRSGVSGFSCSHWTCVHFWKASCILTAVGRMR